MIILKKLLLWRNFLELAVLFIFMILTVNGTTDDKIVVCYISTWSVYRPGNGAFDIEKFDPNLCTHAVHAFAGLNLTLAAIKSLDPWQDLKDDYGKGGYERLTGLKRTYPHLKVSLAIGGWNEGSVNYSLLVADAYLRQKFIKQTLNFLRKYNFDGLDLHWKYPTQRGGAPSDRENFVLLTKELREEFSQYNLILTASIGSVKYAIDQAYDVPQLSQYLDFFHVMCYDYHGHWDNKIGYNAPLMGENVLDVMNAKFTIEYLIALGAPPSKLVLGLPFYGRTFKTSLDGKIGDDTDGMTFQGPFTAENGFLGYNEICLEIYNKTSDWTISWDVNSSQMLARSTRSNGLVKVIAFDSSRSIANKVKFAMNKQLAGVMIWSVDTDDFMGSCEQPNDTYADFIFDNEVGVHLPVLKHSNSSYPLLRIVNEAMVLTLQYLFDIRKK